LAETKIELNDVSCIIPHQPSRRLLESAASTLGVDFSLFKTNMERYANTSGGTVPIILDETFRSGQINKGDLVVFAAVGSGWTWGASVLKWS
jgi:3-oxoacyl-[acyl-carrier-protein] synthase-3